MLLLELGESGETALFAVGGDDCVCALVEEL